MKFKLEISEGSMENYTEHTASQVNQWLDKCSMILTRHAPPISAHLGWCHDIELSVKVNSTDDAHRNLYDTMVSYGLPLECRAAVTTACDLIIKTYDSEGDNTDAETKMELHKRLGKTKDLMMATISISVHGQDKKKILMDCIERYTNLNREIDKL